MVPRGVVKSNSSPSLNDVFSSGDDSPPQKRVRRAESSGLHAHPALQHRAHDAADAAAAAAVLSDLDGLLAPTPAVDSGRFVSDLSIASACIRGR